MIADKLAQLPAAPEIPASPTRRAALTAAASGLATLAAPIALAGPAPAAGGLPAGEGVSPGLADLLARLREATAAYDAQVDADASDYGTLDTLNARERAAQGEVFAFPAATLADVRAKAAVALGVLEMCELDAEEVVAFVGSLVGEGPAHV